MAIHILIKSVLELLVMGTRDRLAIQRSRLANERTLLSYIRTSIVFFATGATMLKLFSNDIFLVIVGELMVISSILITILGVYFYARTRKELNFKNFLPNQ